MNLRRLSAALLAATILLAACPLARADVTVLPIALPSAGSSLVMKSGPGTISSLEVTTTSNAVFLMLVDAATVPATGALASGTVKKCWYIASSQSQSFGWAPSLAPSFLRGIVAILSSTGCFTYTADTTAYVSAEIQ